MEIELQQYRLQIGKHYTGDGFKKKNPCNFKQKSIRSTNQFLQFKLLLSILCILLVCNLHSQNFRNSTSLRKLTYKPAPSTRSRNNLIVPDTVACFLSPSCKWGSLGLSNNKLQSIINGNRRSLGYKLAIWNCERGLIGAAGPSSKLQDIKNFIENKKPHVLGIIETDIFSPKSQNRRRSKFNTAEVKSNLNIEGYSLELPCTWETHGQARILVYVSNDIKYKKKVLSNSDNDLPSITLEIGLGRARKTIVNYYYREWTSGVTGDSSMTGQQERLVRHISQWKQLASQGRDFVSLGDANLCALSWNDPDYRHKNLASQVQSFCLEENCHQLVNGFTRIQSYGNTVQQSCLDHITTNVPDKCSIPEISAGGMSDHMAVIITKYSRDIRHQPKTIKKRNYKQFVAEAFLQDVLENLNKGSFETVLATSDPDVAASHFSGVFGTILNKHAPLKTYQVRNNYAPWLSKATQEKMKLRNKLKVEASEENNIEKLKQYKKLRNEVQTDLVKDKEDYYKNKFYNRETTVGSIWSSVNDYLGTPNKSHSNMPTLLSHNNQTITTPRDIANTFNQIFIEKVRRLRRETDNNAAQAAQNRLQLWLENRSGEIPQFELNPITATKLRKYLKKLKGNRSCGIDFIDGYSIKLAAPIIEEVLLHLVNLSIKVSKYPQFWKSSKINPHFKKGERSNGENYRPVSDIIYVSKIAEAAVFEQTFDHFNSNKLWHPNHHGFRPNFSTATALAQLQDIWVRSAEQKEFTAALLLDLSAAFDVVDHQILLDKMVLYGFSPKTVTWFKSYLMDRSQHVMVESRLSDPLEVGDQGVPQGSLLGPLCFLIFYNDFPAVRNQGESVLYADDDTDNVSGDDPVFLQQKIQMEADLSTAWVQDNRLVCSGNKTKLLVIGTRELRKSRLEKHNLKISINVAGHIVHETQSEKLLGLIINNTMTWTHHMHGNEEHKGLIPKLSQRAGIIRKLSRVMPPEKLRTISNGIFFSLVSYGLQVIGSVSSLDRYFEGSGRYQALTREDSHRIQTIMNVVLRVLTNLGQETPIWLLLKNSGFLSFHQMCAHATLKTTKKILQSKEPVYLYEALKSSRPRSQDVSKVNYKLRISRESFLYQASKLYSLLPEEIQILENPKEFKKKSKAWVSSNIAIYM